jgi:hypothetical protein
LEVFLATRDIFPRSEQSQFMKSIQTKIIVDISWMWRNVLLVALISVMI